MQNRNYSYIAFIDEAGDPGISKVAPIDKNGASEWFTLGCVVIGAENHAHPVDFVKRVKAAINSKQTPDLHYRNLTNQRRRTVCEELAKERLRLFAVVSNKKNMRNYRNRRAEAVSLHPKNWFYNYCIRILLERVSAWVEHRAMIDYGEPRSVHLVFSQRGGHSYRHVQTYTELLKLQIERGNLYQTARAPVPSVFDHRLIEVIAHNKNAGLQMADIVASAFYNAANTNSNTWDIEPAKLLKPRMAMLDDRHNNEGLTFLPWYPRLANLTEDQKRIFRYYGYRF